MVQKLLLSTKFILPTYLIILLFFVFSIDMNAQCAGNDNSLVVCDIANISSQIIDLNSLLGAHTAGGTWSDDNNSGGFNTTTGILNAQQVYKSGVYNYTYTVNVPGCIDTAVITVTIGGYSGVPGPNNSICSSDQAYNLFQVFQGTPVLAPQSGGTWTDLNNSGGLIDDRKGILDASIPDPLKNYSFKYTIDAIAGGCPEVSSIISVSIYRSPKPGIPNNLNLCSDQLDSYTSFDLMSLLNGEDAGGVWSESGTLEISNSTDSTINIKNIYTQYGPGYYSFTYTVSPAKDDRVCTDQSSTVIIAIGEKLDFTGTTLDVNPDVCENSMATTTYSGVLTQGVKPIANGSYNVSYTIAGVGSFSTVQNFSNGVLLFPIASANFSQVIDYTISITDITLTTSPVLCNSIIGTIQDVLHIYPSPKINSATLTIAPVCQGSDGSVEFSGTSNLLDGSYDIVYNLSGSNVLNGIPATMNVLGGLSSFSIPAVYIPKAGTTAITITKITNSITGCSNSSTLKNNFIINPSLDMTNLTTTIKDICQNQPANVTLTGLGVLTSIDVVYNLSGSNIVASKTVSLTASSGQVIFSIPAVDTPNSGITTFTITNVTNTITGCTIALNKSTNFKINPIPNIPVALDQSFCTSDNATVANLAPQGSQYQWFDSVTSTAPLTKTTPLLTGDYYVKEVNPTTGCSSDLKIVHITINTNPQINNAILSIATVCQSYDIPVILSGSSNLTDGNYNILYNLSGSNTATAIPAVLSVTSGVGNFSILRTIAPNAGLTTIIIKNITNSDTGCTNIANISASFSTNPLPDTSNMIVTISDICQGQFANVAISGLGTLTTININFSLSGANTVATNTISLNVIAGNTSFTIPTTSLPNTGLTTLNIIDITNNANSCSLTINKKTDFTVNTLPDVSNMVITVNDGCPNQPLNIDITGLGVLTNVSLNYTLSGANSVNLQTSPLIVSGGNTNFVIPGSALANTGTNTIVITDLTNTITGCSSVVNSISQNFALLPIPSNPVANNQEFCKEDLATVASLIPNGPQFKWYDSSSNTTPLLPTALLVTGNYYLREANPTTGCESNATTVGVLINSVLTPILNSNGPNFCGKDKPTIQNLSNNTNYTGTLTWYDAPSNGLALANTQLLIEGDTYYGIDYNITTKCISAPLEATVTLTSCNVTPDGLFIPDGFSPNGDGVNDTFKIKDIEFLFPNFSLEIFNRYGNIMFKGNINKPDWDGKNSNSNFINGDAATGVYFYIINYNKDNFSPRQGQLYLNR